MTCLHPKRKSISDDDKSLSLTMRERVAESPDAVAITLCGRPTTYGQLGVSINQLAAHLRELGVKTGSRVGVFLDRSVEMITAIFAVLEAGGAYLPLDLACPEDRLRFQLQDADAKIVLTSSALARKLQGYDGLVVCLDHEATKLAEYSGDPVPSSVEPDDLAYVIYTSGSTGQPKGVLVTHRNVLRLLTVTEPLFGFGASDVWTLFHSSAFDFSVWEIFGALLYGGRLVIVPYEISRSATDFHRLLCDEGVTVLNQTPSAFRQLMRADEVADESLAALRSVVFGGEALEFESLRPWINRYGDDHPQLINMYGITETTVHVTYHRVTVADLESGASTIGRPLPDLRVYVVDEKRNLVAPGEVGEMLVGGEGVARGYLNRPTLTQERFIVNPFQDEAAPVVYCSGDLARERPDGTLEYFGRGDHQVKIRGFRIELHEIESVLVRHPAIAECAVLARSDDGGEPRLAAYLVTRPGAQSKIEELRSYLAGTVPDYMVPSAFVFLKELPLTVNGKLDRAALPVPTLERKNLAVGYVAPANVLENTVTELWKKSLKRDDVGTQDNFFDVGGDSLLLTALHRDLEAALQRELPITDLFQFPTISGLVRHLASGTGDTAAQDRIRQRAQRQRASMSRGDRP